MKIDLHCHSYYSKDGVSSPESLIRAALKKGLDGIALTDHNTVKGWEEAKKAAQKLNARLILGEELKIKENNKTVGEIIGYFLKQGIDPKNKTTEQIIKEIKDQGGLAIIVHPFHWKKRFKELEKYRNLADGIEVFNARSQSKKQNQKSFELAQQNNLVMTAGSDCHQNFSVGDAYIESEARTLEEFRNDIMNKKVKIRGKQSSILAQSFAVMGKIIHFFWKP
jgi:predicted metal-dependent phosphoesterase TrpH